MSKTAHDTQEIKAQSPVPGGEYVGSRAVIATSIGNALEWYDFAIYAQFAIYIGRNFFPGGDKSVELIKAFLTFGLGFVIRPLGAVWLGNYADRVGRKAALTLTIMLMATGTLVIALAPTYAVIGIGAPILLLSARVLQGFSAGGEVGGAAAFLVEHAPPKKRGVYASWLQGSMALTNMMAGMVAALTATFLTVSQIGAWGWRIPFLLGGLLIAPTGMWLRRSLSETPHFKEEMERRARDTKARRAPLTQVVRDYPKALIIGTGLSILWGVSVYTLIIYMPTYMQTVFKFTGQQAFSAMFFGNIFMFIGCATFGAISDRVGRVRMMVISAVILALGVYPLLRWLQLSHSMFSLIVVQSAFCLMVAMYSGVAPSALSEIFPTRVRSTGVSISYNAAVTIFGGFAPAILSWLTRSSSNMFAPAGYVCAAGVISLISLCFIRAAMQRAQLTEKSAQVAHA